MNLARTARRQSRFRELAERQFAALDAGQTTPTALHARLTGPEQLWWHCCQEAVHYDGSWLEHRAPQILEFIKARSLPGDGATRRAEATYEAAQILCPPMTDQATRRLDKVAEYWADAPAAGVYQGPRPRFDLPDLPAGWWPARPGPLAGATEYVAEATGHAARVLGLLSLLHLAEKPRRGVRPVRVAVVFAAAPGSGGQGRLAYLELRDAHIGIAGIFPDPAAGHPATDHAFATAVARAWSTVAPRQRDLCVLWRLAFVDESAAGAARVDGIDGGSLGAAFALALRELTRYPRDVRPALRAVHHYFHGFRLRTAVTGALDAEGGLSAVESLDAKAEEARRHGWRLVAPVANAATGTVPRSGVALARTVADADRLSRYWNRRHLLVSVLVAAALTIPPGIVLHESDQRLDQAQADSTVAISDQLAATSLTTDVTTPASARQLALAAWAESPTSAADASMAKLLSEQQQDGMHIGSTDGSNVTTIAFAPDGRLLASGGLDGSVRLWNPQTGRAVDRSVSAGEHNPIDALAFTAQGTVLSAVAWDGMLRRWEVSDQHEIGTPVLAAPALSGGGAFAPVFSPNGTVLATSYQNRTVRLWNTVAGKALCTIPLAGSSNQVRSVAFDPADSVLATAESDDDIQFWNPDDCRPDGAAIDQGTYNDSIAIAFNARGTMLAATGLSGSVLLWNPISGARVGTLSQGADSTNFAETLAFFPDGRQLATGNRDGTVRLWNLTTSQQFAQPDDSVEGMVVALAPNGAFQQLAQLSGSVQGMVDQVAFDPNGAFLASGANDGTVRLWSLPSRLPVGSEYQFPPTTGGVDATAFDPVSPLMATAGGMGTFQLWSTADPPEPVGNAIDAGSGSGLDAVAFSRDGRYLASGDAHGTIRLWDTADWQEVGPPLRATPATACRSLAFTSDGSVLAAGYDDDSMRLWNLAPGSGFGRLIRTDLSAGSDGGSGLLVDPSADIVVTFSDNGTELRRWNGSTGAPIGAPYRFPAASDMIDVAAFDPATGLLAIAAGPFQVTWWNPLTGRQSGTPFTVASYTIALAINPSGSLVAVLGSDRSAQLWNPTTGRPVGAPIPVNNLDAEQVFTFTPDGSSLFAYGGLTGASQWPTATWSDPYQALCDEVGPLPAVLWHRYVSNDAEPAMCTGSSPQEAAP